MANQIVIPLSTINGYGSVFLASCRGFNGESQLTDWYGFAPIPAVLAAMVAPGNGIFTPLPPGPYGLELVNASLTARTLGIVESDNGLDAAGYYSGAGAPYVPVSPTRSIYVPASSTVRVVLAGRKKYLGMKWGIQDALLTGTFWCLTDIDRAPSSVAYGTGFKGLGDYP